MGNVYTPNFTVCEEANTKEETFNKDGSFASVVLRCAWADRHAVTQDLLENNRPYPPLDDWPLPPVVKSVRCLNDGGHFEQDGQMCVYENALLAVEFDNTLADAQDTPPPGSEGGSAGSQTTYVRFKESFHPAVQYMTLDYRKFRWTDANGDALAEGEAPGLPQYEGRIVREFEKWYPPLPIELLTLIGTCNLYTYNSPTLGLSFPPETLLYLPPTLHHTIKSNGVSAASGQVEFAFKKNGWNTFWRQKTKTFERIFSIDSNTEYYNFPKADFSAILDVAQTPPEPTP